MKQQNKRFSNLAKQAGASLIEVMIAVFISAVGLLGAAAMQLNALKYTDSALMTSQASFIAYDIIDRMRANAANLAGYSLANIASAPGSAVNIQDQDLLDFATGITALTAGDGSIQVNGSQVTVSINWSEGRAAGLDEAGKAVAGTFSVTSQITN